jgi:hypothetical protein
VGWIRARAWIAGLRVGADDEVAGMEQLALPSAPIEVERRAGPSPRRPTRTGEAQRRASQGFGVEPMGQTVGRGRCCGATIRLKKLAPPAPSCGRASGAVGAAGRCRSRSPRDFAGLGDGDCGRTPSRRRARVGCGRRVGGRCARSGDDRSSDPRDPGAPAGGASGADHLAWVSPLASCCGRDEPGDAGFHRAAIRGARRRPAGMSACPSLVNGCRSIAWKAAVRRTRSTPVFALGVNPGRWSPPDR